MIEINVEFPQREIIQATAEVDNEQHFTSDITINAKPEITGVTASVDNNTGTPSVDVTETGTGTDFSFDLAFHNLKGDKGDTGATGQDGQAATISVGTVSTGAAGTSATVVNSGTSSAAVFDFTIPQGAKGDTGNTGATGADGYSPSATVTQSGDVTTISITDKNGTTTESIDLSNYVESSDLATVATSGSYNDLINKPTIPAAQVNSDWNSNSGVSQILNKPTLATVATSGSYNDLTDKPTIPTVNNATLTITQGGVSKGTFTANASSNVTIALDAGGGGGSTYTAGTGLIIDNNNEISVAQTDAQEGRYTWSNLTEVGTLTESHKVYSGFSSANYLAMTSYPTTISSLEIQWDITTPADVQIWGCIMGQSSNNFKTPQFEVEDGKFDFVISSNGTSWTTWMECACQASTHYILNFSWDGTYYNATLTDDNDNVTSFTLHSGSATGSNITWTEVANIGKDTVSSGVWNGSINIGNSYIKVNGALFDISMNNVGDVAKATSSLYGLVKPDNTTITVSDGVISSTQEVFIATYNTTSFSEIETAYNAGKSVFVKDYGLLVPLINYDVSRASFRGIDRGSGTYNFRCVEITATLNGSSTTWNNVVYQLELTRNLVTSISSSSTDTEYPSAKCVYDIPHVIETYSNGTEGWRKWSDGYYEEWGYWNRNTSISAGSNASTTINLLNSFGNTNYNISLSCQYTSTNSAMGEELKAHSVGYQGFTLTSYNRNSSTASGTGVGFSWRVCGYITTQE